MCEVTVIVPIYKGKKYISNVVEMLEKNVDLLCKQKELETSQVELLFINDYPMEDIQEKDFFSEKLSIKLITNPQNQGIHQSRVNGLNIAKGKYVQFLDQDDTISEDYLLTQLQNVGDADAVLCNGIWRGNKRIYRDLKEHKLASQKEGYYPQKTWLVSPGQLLIKKTFIPEEWKKYILRESGSDDALLWLLMLRDSQNIAINSQVAYFHNEDGANTSFNFKKMSRSIKEMMNIIDEHISFEQADYEILKKGQMIRINRYDAYGELEEHWEDILENVGRLITDVSLDKVAIYGYGIIGKKLVEDLKAESIDIDIVIDKDADKYKDTEKQYYLLEQLQEEIELLIVTPIFDKDKIIKDLSGNSYLKKIVMLDELKGEKFYEMGK